MSKEPTNPELIASASSIALTGRRLIDSTDRTSFRDVGEALDALHEHLGVAGGALLILARRLGCEAEVERMLKEGQDRVTAFRAGMGMGGKA
ncbi:hypothetical protein GIY56_06100 [Paracoccus sp. YIM 132242]|uniref:Uncharacterized protein n=1 Tax=Paracoccus lichenicola TaxID=2665644 RepID=A0A6L6HN79_9RHOB|nr:hypothetical protein [Paracoccus lichenicola]MTD99851.1 hypothetical protein [Paracoccus lichenicola]